MTSRTSTSSPASAGSPSPRNGRDSEQSRSAKLTDSANEFSENTGPIFPFKTISEPSDGAADSQLLSLAGHLASELVLPPLFRAQELGKHFGQKWPELSRLLGPRGLSLNNLREMKNGKVWLRHLWRALATIIPDLNERLRIVAHLIAAGECSLLPTPVASDSTRSPGSEGHSRLNKSRGLRLQEELGGRPGPEIVEWMMGYPIGWTDSRHLGTRWSPKSHTKSSRQSRR